MRPRRAPTRGAPTVIGDWSDRAARNRPSSGRLEVAPPGKEHGARETRPSQSARETRRSKRRPEGRRSQSAPRTTPLLPGVRHWKFQRKRRRGDTGMIPRETGRGLSIRGAHRVAAVERLIGATLVVALPLNGDTVRRPLLGHYRTGGVERRLSSRRLGSASGAACFTRRLGPASFRAPGMATWSGDSAGERCDPAGHPQGVPLRSSGIGPTGRLETALPVGDWKSPLRASDMIPRETGRG